MIGQRNACLPLVLGCFILAVLAGQANAQSDSGEEVRESLRELQSQFDQLRQDNARMQDELDQLRAADNQQWLTERRAEQIRGLVSDVLADADSRASLLQNGMTAGWNDGFFLSSADGRFRLNLAGLTQIRWVYNFQDNPFGDRHRQGFENTRTRLTFNGNVFGPDISYLIRGEFDRDGGGGTNVSNSVLGGNFRLLDSWIRLRLNNAWSIRFGQFHLPFNREELVSPAYQLAAERSVMNKTLSIGRSQGIQLEYLDRDNRWWLMVSDGGDDRLANQGSLAGRTPANTPALDQDVEFALTTRYERKFAGSWDQFTDFTSPVGDPFGMMAGIAAHWQKDEATGAFSLNRNEDSWFAATADLSLEWGGANVFTEAIYHYVDSAASGTIYFYGFLVQGGVYVTPKVETFLRYEAARFDTRDVAVEPKLLSILTAGVNYYFDGHDAKWTTDIGFGLTEVQNFYVSDIAGYRVDGEDNEPQIVFRTQFQLLF